MSWMTTPDRREGWSNLFLRKGHRLFLIDQPRRGEAGQTSYAGTISNEISDQTWYTQFRIGTYINDQFTFNENSQFLRGEENLDQFFTDTIITNLTDIMVLYKEDINIVGSIAGLLKNLSRYSENISKLITLNSSNLQKIFGSLYSNNNV